MCNIFIIVMLITLTDVIYQNSRDTNASHVDVTRVWCTTFNLIFGIRFPIPKHNVRHVITDTWLSTYIEG